jgi:hypothetical protein
MTKPYCIGSDEWNGLSKLIEELGELQQVCGKLIGSEGNLDNWGVDLKEKFIEELGDVSAAMDFFVVRNFDGYDITRIEAQRCLKYDRFNKWSKEIRDAKN